MALSNANESKKGDCDQVVQPLQLQQKYRVQLQCSFDTNGMNVGALCVCLKNAQTLNASIQKKSKIHLIYCSLDF